MKALSKITTIGLAGLAITILLLMFVIRPVLNKVKAANEQLRQGQNDLVLLEQQILAFQTAQNDITKASRRSEIMSKILDKEKLAVAVIELETAAAKTGTTAILDIQDPDPTNPKDPVVLGKRGVGEVAYRVTTLNDYVGTINFLSFLEHLPHGTEIDKIDLSAEIRQGEAGKNVRTGKVLGTFDGVFFINNTNHE